MPLSRGSGPFVPGIPSNRFRNSTRDRATAHSGQIGSSRASRQSGSWAIRYRFARCRRLHERVAGADAAVAQTFAACIAQAEVAVNQRVHDAVLEPELVPLVAVPVDLGIDVVAVQTLRAGVEIVVDIASLVRGGTSASSFTMGPFRRA